jgi:hypothetical protein
MTDSDREFLSEQLASAKAAGRAHAVHMAGIALRALDRLAQAEALLREVLPHMNTGFNFPADRLALNIRAFLGTTSATIDR